MSIETQTTVWCAVWRSSGISHLLRNECCVPVLFKTRREAREWIEQRYGYTKHRPDLRGAPHGWRMPVAVRCRVSIQESPANG